MLLESDVDWEVGSISKDFLKSTEKSKLLKRLDGPLYDSFCSCPGKVSTLESHKRPESFIQ